MKTTIWNISKIDVSYKLPLFKSLWDILHDSCIIRNLPKKVYYGELEDKKGSHGRQNKLIRQHERLTTRPIPETDKVCLRSLER